MFKAVRVPMGGKSSKSFGRLLSLGEVRDSWLRFGGPDRFLRVIMTDQCGVQLLDSGEVQEVSGEGNSRKKPLPATYEPGAERRSSIFYRPNL
jgi:hypothetical protein